MNSASPFSPVHAAFAAALLASLSFTMPALAADKDDVLPPPTEVHDSPAAQESVQTKEKAPNLSEELKGSDKGSQVEVYSYQRNDGATVEEYSLHGKVYMIKVQPAGGMPPYYLYDESGQGNFTQLPGGYKRPSPPTWVLKRF